MSDAKLVVTTRLDPETKKLLQAMAAVLHVSMEWLFEEATRKFYAGLSTEERTLVDKIAGRATRRRKSRAS